MRSIRKGATIMNRKNNKQKELFVKVNKRLTRETNLIAQINGAVKGGYETLAAIALFIDEDGRAFPSQAELAKQCGVSRQTINARIKALTEFTTKDGQKVLEAVTIREGLNKTRTFYRLLPASGFTFIHDVPDEVVKSALQANNSNNEVINSTLQRQEIVEGCEESSKVVKSTLQGIVTKSNRLSYVLYTKKNSVITKTIKEDFSIEQDNNTPNGDHLNFDNTNFVEIDYNKDNINKDLLANNSLEYKTDKLGDNTAINDNLSPVNIVANKPEKQSDISDNHNTVHGAGTVTNTDNKPLSMSKIARLMSEEYCIERENEEAKKREDKANNKGLKEHEIVAFRTQYSPNLAAEIVSRIISPDEENNGQKEENKDEDDFLALVKAIDEDYRSMYN